MRRRSVLRSVGLAAAALLLLIAAVGYFGRTAIQRVLLDPGVPYQIYRPPPAPDYARASAWALLADSRGATGPTRADVFFVHPTTYDGGREWNSPIGDPKADALLARVMLPNFAGPLQRVGRVFAPRYRQASLYAASTLRDDAREARRFAYRDVSAAFSLYLARWNGGRPLILVGVGQGGTMVERLVLDLESRPKAVLDQVAAVYLVDTVVPAAAFGPTASLPACRARTQAHCVVGWTEAPEGGESAARTLLDRALVWGRGGQLDTLDGRPALCVNPLTGVEHGAASERDNLGAVEATGLEWGARPAFLPRQVSAECRGGLLRVSRPASADLRAVRGGIAHLREPSYNLFYADIEADALARLAAFGGAPAPPIRDSIAVRPSPVHRID